MKAGRNNVVVPSIKLFEGERLLVMISMIGFILAAGIAIFIYFQDPIILPEGNLGDAFSFNAAFGIFVLSIAAILPLAGFETRTRKRLRWLFILASLFSYFIETVQNFRGINPRFSQAGSVIDMIGGMLFGVVSIIFVVSALLLTIQFFRIKYPYERPLLIMGIRYALLSVLIANGAGIWMIVLQDRFTGNEGNLIVLHGMGFHALQTLIFSGWILEKVPVKGRYKKMLIHYGSTAWLLSIILIGFQTVLGHSVFELTALPILASILLLIWFGTVMVSCVLFIKKGRINFRTTDEKVST